MSDATTAAAAAAIPAPRTPHLSAMDRFPLARHVQAVVDQGVHPATRAPIRQATTCGSCVHAVTKPLGDGTCRTRCELAVSRRGGPDILPGFPGCDHHDSKEPAS
jgi:hypothetical protein